MFWIPLCVVVGFIFFCKSMYYSVKEGNQQYIDERRNKIRNDFRTLVSDTYYESQLKEKHGNKYSSYDDDMKIIEEFVGSPCVSDSKYPMIPESDTWAIAAEMCRHRKLPLSMASSSFNSITDKHSEREFTDKFFAKLESELQRVGIDTFLILERTEYDTKTGRLEYRHWKFSDFIASNGFGRTTSSDRFNFVQNSIHVLEYIDQL